MAKQDGIERHDLSDPREAVSAGEPLNPEVIKAFRDAFGCTIRDGYGQTENTLLAGNLPQMEVRPGSMGLPAPCHDLHVIDREGAIAAAGEEGDVALRGDPPTLFAGYWNQPDETPQSAGASGTSPETAPRATRTATSGSPAARTM